MAEATGSSSGTAKRSTSKSTKKATKRSASDKRSASKKTSAQQSTSGSGKQRSTSARRAPRAAAPNRKSGAEIAQAAVRQLRALAAKEVEGVTSLERTDDGWRLELDVLELRRVPNTTDVLATYEVLMDSDGDLDSYRRLHRYVRGSADEDRA
jgi:hypothetical protein